MTKILQTLESNLNYDEGAFQKVINKKELELIFRTYLHASEESSNVVNSIALPVTETTATDISEQIEELKKTWEQVSTKDWTFSDLSLQSIADEISAALESYLDESDAGPITTATTTLAAVSDSDDATVTAASEAVESFILSTKTLIDFESSVEQILQNAEEVVLDETEAVIDEFFRAIIATWEEEIIPYDTDPDPDNAPSITEVREGISQYEQTAIAELSDSLNMIIHDGKFKTLESSWLGLKGLLDSIDWTGNIIVDLLDCTRDEIESDFNEHSVDLTNSEFFKKVYVEEYDQYGGQPFGAILGIYDFENTAEDRDWLTVMSQVATASHTPFIASVGPKFFNCNSIQELAELKDIEGLMAGAAYDRWNDLRDTEEAAYLGFTVPKYLVRAPYDPEANPSGTSFAFTEVIDVEEGHEDYLWASATYLFGQNLARSFTENGWCQYIRGPKSGGLIESLPRYEFELNGQKQTKTSVETIIPDYLELQYANSGFIPLVYRKGTTDACFFSCQSIKKSKEFIDPNDTENSQLVTNLSYTFSITRIAHYIKSIMRDNIGSSADESSINTTIQNWLDGYVTTVVSPSDLTLRHYPFKAAQVVTTPQEGMIGWYNCEITILPHIQFEGMDVELKMDVRL